MAFVVSGIRNFLISDILHRWKNTDLQTAFTYGTIDRELSNTTPIFLAMGEQDTISSTIIKILIIQAWPWVMG